MNLCISQKASMFQTKRDLWIRKMVWRCSLVILVLGLAAIALAGEVCIAEKSESVPAEGEAASPLYLLTYDHGGVVLWGQ